MNMTNKTIMRFLKLYRRNTCLWNPNLMNYKNRKSVNSAWEDIKENLGIECTVAELKKKKESLMSAYRSYKTRIRRSEKLGTGEVYQPTWFAYNYMDSFLGDVYKCSASTSHNEDEDRPADQDNEDLSNEKDPLLTITDEATPLNKQNRQETPHHFFNETKDLHKPESRKRPHDTKISQAKNQIDDAFKLMKTTPHNQDFDDECSIFGLLVAKKLQKLSEERRDVMMVKINQLFVDERNESRQLGSSDQADSVSSMAVVTKTLSSPEHREGNASGLTSSLDIEDADFILKSVKIEMDPFD